MAATTSTLLSLYTCDVNDDSSPPPTLHSFLPISTQLCFFLFLLIIFILYTTIRTKINNKQEQQNSSSTGNENVTKHGPGFNRGPARKLVVEIFPSYPRKWDTLFSEVDVSGEAPGEESGSGLKRAKKRPCSGNEGMGVCLYPFSKGSSSMQRKIKSHYDVIVKAYVSKKLTLDQIGQFVNYLIEAKNELQQRSNVIKRKYSITMALFSTADRSSYDRICQKIHKIELEQKRLEEDAYVYNWTQDQLKVSPAYKKMLEATAAMERKEKSSGLLESEDADFSDMSFEEFLAQEKKDKFWQRNGRVRPCSN